MGTVEKRFDPTFWTLEQASAPATLYVVGYYVFGSNLSVYQLNADKGGAVPGDPTTDPTTGDGSSTADWVIQAPPAAGAADSQTYTLTATHLATGITLTSAPVSPTKTILIVKGFPGQFYGDDFTVAGAVLTLDPALVALLVVGDKVTVQWQ